MCTMLAEMKTFTEIIDAWPSVSEFASEVGVPYGVAAQWRRRNSIPSKQWLALIYAGRARGVSISADCLAAIAGSHAEAAE